MPKVRPALSIGIGTGVAVVLAVSGLTSKIVPIFVVVGAAFGPLVGAMTADYLLSGRKWPGPRAGFNPAGWISLASGFIVGIADFGFIPGLKGNIPCPPLSAYLVGFAVYFILAKILSTARKTV